MVELSNIFSSFKPFTAIVIGDLMIDRYTKGSVSRISPEAPVSVLQVESEEERAGGAGNVALNLTDLGASVHLMGRVGDDSAGKRLLSLLQKEKILASGIVCQEGFLTPVKNRLMADGQQLVRVDYERRAPLSKKTEEEIIAQYKRLLPECGVVAISDYNKGLLTTQLLKEIILLAKEKGIPVLCDPKGKDFTKYEKATLIKPNLKEAYEAMNASKEIPIDEVGGSLLEQTKVDHLVITRSADGISLFTPGEKRRDFAVHSQEVVDVTGAGDTVLATLACSFAHKQSLESALVLANLAAGISVKRLGCARVTLSDLAKAMLKRDQKSKVFDENHIYALEKFLLEKSFSIVVLSSKEGLTTKIYQTIHKLYQKDHHELIIYLEDSPPDEDFLQLLTSLREVEFIILKKESLQKLCKKVQPKEIVSMSGSDVEESSFLGQLA